MCFIGEGMWSGRGCLLNLMVPICGVCSVVYDYAG